MPEEREQSNYIFLLFQELVLLLKKEMYSPDFYSQGDLKSETLKNLEKYVHRDAQLPLLLNR